MVKISLPALLATAGSQPGGNEHPLFWSIFVDKLTQLAVLLVIMVGWMVGWIGEWMDGLNKCFCENKSFEERDQKHA